MVDNKDPDTKKTELSASTRRSNFAARVAKKRTNLDQKVAKLRKKSSAGIKKNEQSETAGPQDASVSNDENQPVKPQPITEPEADSVQESQTQMLTATKKSEEASGSTNEPPAKPEKAAQFQTTQSKDEEIRDVVGTGVRGVKRTSVSSAAGTIRSGGGSGLSSVDKDISQKSIGKPSSPVSPLSSPGSTKDKARVAPAVQSGLFGGGSGASVEPEVLINSFLQILGEYPELTFLDSFRSQLKKTFSASRESGLNVLVVGSQDKEFEVFHSATEKLPNELALAFSALEGIRQTKLQLGPHCDTAMGCSWASIAHLNPLQIGTLREIADIIVIASSPSVTQYGDAAQLLQRLVGSGKQIIIANESFINTCIKPARKSYATRTGYTVLEKSRISEAEIDNQLQSDEILYSLLNMVEDDVALESYIIQRRLYAFAINLESKCNYELERQTFITATKGAIEDKSAKHRYSKALDSKITKLFNEARKQFSSDDIYIDELGLGSIRKQEGAKEAASALVSRFSDKDVVFDNELDQYQFSEGDSRYINRLRRFQFAGKLGVVWKLKQEFIESLHEKLSARIVSDTCTTHKQVDSYLKKEIKKLKSNHESMTDDQLVKLEKAFKSWPTAEQLSNSITGYYNFSHFRSALFSKRGASAPVETQQGIMKELRESRMFVSQLMAFGMLFALLFGSSFAVDVLLDWFAGGGANIGSELTQAAQDSRSVGRQIRILIQAIAGLAIIFYIGLRIYLKPSEKLLNKSKLVGTYKTQLEDVCANFLDDAGKMSKELIQSHLQHLQDAYTVSNVAEDIDTSVSQHSIASNSRGAGKNDRIRSLQELKKWISAQIAKRDNHSLVKVLESSTSKLLEELKK